MKPSWLLLTLFLAAPLAAEIIPVERRVEWDNAFTGIPGGIPWRTNIFCDVTVRIPGSFRRAEGDGWADDTRALQDALDRCPSNQVVYLPRGTYKITDNLRLVRSGVSLRGAGLRETVIAAYGASQALQIGSYGNEPPPVDIASGGDKGSSNIVVASVAGLSPGSLILVDQLNHTNGAYAVSAIGWNGSQPTLCNHCDRDQLQGTRIQMQLVEVQHIAGQTLAIWPPLSWHYTHQPQYTRIEPATRYVGVESLSVSNANGLGAFNVYLRQTMYCWMTNFGSRKAVSKDFQGFRLYRCEFMSLWVDQNRDPTKRIYGWETWEGTCGTRLVDSIFDGSYAPVEFYGGCNRNVVAYNFTTNSNEGNKNLVGDVVPNHGGHCHMNLFEGNVFDKFYSDAYFGTSAHQTLFRNLIRGSHDRRTDFNRCIEIMEGHRFFNVAGNVLGGPGKHTAYEFESRNGAASNVRMVYKLGYRNNGDQDAAGNDPLVAATLLRHGNFDYVHGKTLWDPAIADRQLPPSCFLNARPSWWGDLPWPPFGPEGNPARGSIPAQMRFNHIPYPYSARSAKR